MHYRLGSGRVRKMIQYIKYRTMKYLSSIFLLIVVLFLGVFLVVSSVSADDLPTPILTAPVPNAVLEFMRVPLDWLDVPGADTYEIRYARTGEDCNITSAPWIELDDHPPASSINLPLLPPARYCWKVMAEGHIDSSWSAPRAFTLVSADLPTPILTAPVPNAALDFTPRVELNWDDVTGADEYEIRYARTGENCNSIGDASWTQLDDHPSVSSFDLPPLSPARYCWKVMAEGQDGGVNVYSSWSEKRAFTLNAPDIDEPPPGECTIDGDCDEDAGETYTNCPEDCPPGNGVIPKPVPGSGIFTLENPITSQTLPELANRILNFFFMLAIVIAPILVLYAGFLMLTAGGNPEKLQTARTVLVWTVIAFAIILVAKGFPNVIRSLL